MWRCLFRAALELLFATLRLCRWAKKGGPKAAPPHSSRREQKAPRQGGPTAGLGAPGAGGNRRAEVIEPRVTEGSIHRIVGASRTAPAVLIMPDSKPASVRRTPVRSAVKTCGAIDGAQCYANRARNPRPDALLQARRDLLTVEQHSRRRRSLRHPNGRWRNRHADGRRRVIGPRTGLRRTRTSAAGQLGEGRGRRRAYPEHFLYGVVVDQVLKPNQALAEASTGPAAALSASAELFKLLVIPGICGPESAAPRFDSAAVARSQA